MINWTRMRKWTLITAAATTLAIAILIGAALAYTGQLASDLLLWPLTITAATLWALHATAASHADTADAISRLREEMDEWGERREHAGQTAATRYLSNGHSKPHLIRED